MYIYGKQYDIHEFSKHYQAFKVIYATKSILISSKQLINHRPLSFYGSLDSEDSNHYVRLSGY
jgi:hypothetical protein